MKKSSSRTAHRGTGAGVDDNGQTNRPTSRQSLRNMFQSSEAPDPKRASVERTRRVSQEASPYARVAAAKALQPEPRLPDVPHETDLSRDLQYLTMDDAPRDGEDEADRNMQRREQQRILKPSSAQQYSPKSFHTPLLDSKRGQYVYDAPERRAMSGGADSVPASFGVNNKGVAKAPAEIARDIQPRRTLQQSLIDSSANDIQPSNLSSAASTDPRVPTRSVKRSSLKKPLPPVPMSGSALPDRGTATATTSSKAEPVETHDSGVGSPFGSERDYLIKDGTQPIDLEGVVNLRDTEDTTLRERWAPAVTHETIIQNVHEIREERITREIHNYHIHHRILPIIDIEVLPARHFIPVEGGYEEIVEDEVSGRVNEYRNWVIAETVSKMLPKTEGHVTPRHFTARKFEGSDGDYKEYTTPEGFVRKETTWIHPPTLETGGQRTGQTYAFHFGSPNQTENGLKARLPPGAVIGSSITYAQQQAGKQNVRALRLANSDEDVPPPVPPHEQFPAAVEQAVQAKPTVVTLHSKDFIRAKRY